MTREFPHPLLLIDDKYANDDGCDKAGGNQRELARAKNQKKLAEANKGKRSESNTSIAARKEADAEALRAKQAVRNGVVGAVPRCDC